MSDSHCVFTTLARPVLSLNLALSGRFVRLANFLLKPLRGSKYYSETSRFALQPLWRDNFTFGTSAASKVLKTRFSRIAKTSAKQSEINQNDEFMTFIQNPPRIKSKMGTLEIAQLDPLPRTPQMTIYDRFNFCLKSPAGIKIITF